MMAMEATIFTGWIYDYLLPHAEKVKVAHPLMLRAIAAAKKKNDKIDAAKIADCLRCDCPSATWHRPRFAIGGECCAIAIWS
jgi:transposase